MRTLRRIAWLLALGFTPALSAVAEDGDSDILKKLVSVPELGAEAATTGGTRDKVCNGNDAADVAGQAGQSGRDTDPASVLDKTWEWEATITMTEKTMVPDPGRYTIRLTNEGRLQARFDCNRGGGDYTLSAGRLTFGPMLSTRMACPPDSLDASFMGDLEKVESFYVQDGKLFLEFKGNAGTMRFRRAT